MKNGDNSQCGSNITGNIKKKKKMSQPKWLKLRFTVAKNVLSTSSYSK